LDDSEGIRFREFDKSEEDDSSTKGESDKRYWSNSETTIEEDIGEDCSSLTSSIESV
jgi:hypothetical protein